MRLVSFDALRSLGLPGVTYVKPEQMFAQRGTVEVADWVLFPAYWQLGALAFGLGARLFPSLPSYLLGHDKIEMTRALTMVAPRHLPYTVIEPNTPEAAARAWDALPLPFVAKIPRSSQGEGVFLVRGPDDWRDYLRRSPVIYAQEYLPIDRDLRVVLVGDRVVGHYWRLQSNDGFRNNLARGGRVSRGPAPPAALALVAQVATELGIDHAGFDVAIVDGHPYLLEFNRLFGNRGLPGGSRALADVMLDYLRRRLDLEGPHRPDGRPPRLPIAV